jgi:protein TonB
LAAASATPAVSASAAPLEAPSGVREETGLAPEVTGGVPDGVLGGVAGIDAATALFVPAVPPPPPDPPPAPAAPVRPGGQIRMPTRITYVAPTYPPLAVSARVEGIVVLDATLDVDGRVTQARVLRSIPLLDQAALEAVRQWRYSPTLLNGVPVPVVMTVTVQFTLGR